MVTRDQLAHDLAVVYLNNRYGPEVTGSFDVSTYDDDVTGTGAVGTQRLPAVNDVLIERVRTGEKRFGIFNKTVAVESGFEVDAVFKSIVEDYFLARDRFCALLGDRFGEPPPTDLA